MYRIFFVFFLYLYRMYDACLYENSTPTLDPKSFRSRRERELEIKKKKKGSPHGAMCFIHERRVSN